MSGTIRNITRYFFICLLVLAIAGMGRFHGMSSDDQSDLYQADAEAYSIGDSSESVIATAYVSSGSMCGTCFWPADGDPEIFVDMPTLPRIILVGLALADPALSPPKAPPRS